MNCPKCGYAMTDFDVDCPRCRRNEQANNQPTPDLILPGNTSGTNVLPPQAVFDMGWCWGLLGLV